MSNRILLSSFSLAAALSFGLVLSLTPAHAAAQINVQHTRKSVPIERIASGKVINKAGTPIGGAVVYLKDARTNSVKTYIADDDGNFRFGELSQDTDYELWAESNGVRSKSRQISSFNSENQFNFTLKVDAPKTISLD